jgi:pimeloyl-ACP methyl ester carboxylesterase
MLRTLPLVLLTAALAGCSGVRYASAPPLPFAEIDYGFPTQRALEAPAVAFVDVGSGDQTLLLVHGLASNAGFWRYTIPELVSAGYRVVAVDLPGFGKSDKGAYPYTMSFQAGVLARLIQTLDLGPVVYVGHSMGGQIGLTLALTRPELVDRLVLAAPAGIERFGPGEGAWLASALTVDGITRASEEAIRTNLAMNFYRWRPEWEWMVEERARMARDPEMRQFSYAVIRSVRGMLDEPTTDRLGGRAAPDPHRLRPPRPPHPEPLPPPGLRPRRVPPGRRGHPERPAGRDPGGGAHAPDRAAAGVRRGGGAVPPGGPGLGAVAAGGRPPLMGRYTSSTPPTGRTRRASATPSASACSRRRRGGSSSGSSVRLNVPQW